MTTATLDLFDLFPDHVTIAPARTAPADQRRGRRGRDALHSLGRTVLTTPVQG